METGFKAEETAHSKAGKRRDPGVGLGTVCGWMWCETQDRGLKLGGRSLKMSGGSSQADRAVVPGESV